MQISEIRKILYKRGFKISKLRKKDISKSTKNIYFTLVSSLVIVLVFYFLPSATNFIAKKFSTPSEINNYSKLNLEKILSGEKLITDNSLDEKLNQKYLYEDIEFKKGPSKSVRIEASM